MMEIGREVKPVEFINTDVWGIEHALRWCHNLQNTWARSDSGLCKGGDDGIGCVHCAIRQRCSHFYNREFVLGIRDMELMQGLIWAGGEKAEFLRMIHVAVDLVTDMGKEAEWKKDAAGKMGDGAVCVTWDTNYAKLRELYKQIRKHVDRNVQAVSFKRWIKALPYGRELIEYEGEERRNGETMNG